MIKSIAIALLLTFAVPAFAQELNIPKGKDFSYTTRMVGNGTAKYNQLRTYTFHSLGKNTDGNNVLECKLVKVVLKDPRGAALNVNTEETQANSLNSTLILDTWAVLQQPFKVIINSKGKVVGYEGIDQIIEEAAKKWHLSPSEEKRVVAHKMSLTSDMQKMFFQIPETTMDTPGEWRAKNGTVYKIGPALGPQLPQINLNKEITEPKKRNTGEGPFLKVSFSGTKTTNEKGAYILDAQTGLVVSSTVNTDFELNYSSVKDHILNDYSQEIDYNPTTTKADTAWINMAVNMSTWSDAFKTGNDYDLDKMQRYFKANDAKFATDPYYQKNKLGAFQKVKSERATKVYDSVLLATPSQYLFLKDDLHTALTNKFRKLAETDAQKAYETAKVFHNTDSFYETLQDDVAQTFRPEMGVAGLPTRNIGMTMLKLMVNDKDAVLRKEILPLYLWATANATPIDVNILTTNAAQLAAMDNQTMQLGRGGRYALMVYKLLLNAGKKTEAQKLLDAAISKMQVAMADTLYKYRADEKNALAYAWHLKYEAEKAAGNANAIQSLAMAAQNSPSGPTDKTYMQSYEHVFLESKESYRQEFIETLFSSGNEQQALKVFASHISAEPESLLQMKALYESKFPGKDFKKVFEKDIIGSWATAPDFALKDLDNNEHILKDHLGKWLLIDFWGTWCGPCVFELPKINAFNKELAGNKNAAFISIACQDFDQTVRAFMKKNDYIFPVLMSDNFIQRKYKATGFPYKVLVSPTGKMIPIEYGKDWQSILKTFSSI